jgi:hypothetical protein
MGSWGLYGGRAADDGTVVAGVPARPICSVAEYRDKHANELLMTKHMSCDEKHAYVETRLHK